MNYYEMLGLPCDGRKIHDTDLIEKALQDWDYKMTVAICNEPSKAGKDKLLDESEELLVNMKKLLTDKGLRIRLSRELKSVRLAQLDAFIGFMKKHGMPAAITSARVQKIAESLGLEYGTVHSYFEHHCYMVKMLPWDCTYDFLLMDSDFDQIRDTIEQLSLYTKKHPFEPLQEIANATNLYEYIAVMDGKTIADAKEYESMDTPTLYRLFSEKQWKHISSFVITIHYRRVEVRARMIMRDDSQRQKYDNSLKLQKLLPLFKEFETLHVSIKLDSAFITAFMKEISQYFPDRKQAGLIFAKYSKIPPEFLFD